MRFAEFPIRVRCAAALAALAGAVFVSTPAAAQHHAEVHPYLEVQQVMSADFDGGGEVLTYTSLGAGIDASIETRRVHATVSYNYQHYFSWQKGEKDSDSHMGLAAARLDIVPNTLTLDAGAIATKGGDVRGAGPGSVVAGDLADVYSVYAGPTLSTHAGALAINASYHIGYVKVDDDEIARPAGTPRIDHYTSSTVQMADASIGMSPGPLPFGWTVGAGWVHEDMDYFDSRYEGKYIRGDLVVPVSAHLAATGGLGYEDIQASQRDLLRDANGIPIVTPSGQVTSDPAHRITTYDQDGEIWDVGLIYRPNPRTEAQARYGRRYGSDIFTASLRAPLSRTYSLNAFVYDTVSSFGRLMVTDLNGVPTRFNIRRNPLFAGIGPGGCIFGSEPGTGTCFNDALQSVANFNFRNRGATAMISGGKGPWTFGLGAGYANRRYISPRTTGFVLDGVTDESFTLDAVASRSLNNAGFDIETFAAWYDSGLVGDPNNFTAGWTFNYYRNLMGDRLSGNIAAGIYYTDTGLTDSTVGSLLLGLRYTF